MLEDENTQLKETLRRNELAQSQSRLRNRADSGRFESLEQAWAEEKRGFEAEVEKLKEVIKVAEERSAKDIATISTLEEKLKESSNSTPPNLDDLSAEDLNDELRTTRQSLYFICICCD
jgi:hypothetical protein